MAAAAVIEALRPITNQQISIYFSSNSIYSRKQKVFCCRYRVLSPKSCILVHNSSSSFVSPSRVSNHFYGDNFSSGFVRNHKFRYGVKVRANSSCEHDTDSTETSDSTASDATRNNPGSSSGSGPSSSRKEKQGKGKWWWSKGNNKWRCQPILQAPEIGVLLLQLGMVMFVMRLLRPGIPLPGSEPRAPTTLVSVPYSEFLSKINNNQVQKVEVDGVHIMFKLKGTDEVAGGNVGVENEVYSKLQESELLLKSISPTKRVVYTTTRPVDIKTPYEKMLENDVEFGSPDKRSGGFLNSALVRFVSSFEMKCDNFQ